MVTDSVVLEAANHARWTCSQSTELFRIEDETGGALIDPSNAQCLLRASRVQGHSGDSLSEHRALLSRLGYTMLDDYGELRSLAFVETIIAPDTQICALSHQADPSGTASYREQPQQTVISPAGETALLLSAV